MHIRKSEDRGHANHGWLHSHHTFSFAEYFDPEQMGFGVLRVINDDTVAAAKGFGTHGHRNMEIISYVLDGELQHRDSMGNGSVIRPGDVQRLSAGRGITHSEFNPSADAPVHFLQIWIVPSVQEVTPSYAQRHFPVDDRRGRLALIASGDAALGSLQIHQDARIYAGLFDGTEERTLDLAPDRLGYVHLARGRLMVNGIALAGGDGLKVTQTSRLHFSAGAEAEVLVFDLPAPAVLP